MTSLWSPSFQICTIPNSRHDTISEDIYVQQPAGFQVKGGERKVNKLHKALYGLKQTPRAWYSKIDDHLIKLGFKRSDSEPTLYLKPSDSGLHQVISLYVDDMLITGNDDNMVTAFKQDMKTRFDMSDFDTI